MLVGRKQFLILVKLKLYKNLHVVVLFFSIFAHHIINSLQILWLEVESAGVVCLLNKTSAVGSEVK